MIRFLLLLASGSLLSLALLQGDPEDEKRKPENAVKNLRVAEGLQAQLFASEPMMTNPTNMAIDHRGRVWVCEAYNYRPEINGNPVHPEGDRIIIMEDTDADAKADKQTVFYQGPEIASPLGIWVFDNKAIVSQSPYLWLFTDTDGDDRADKKEVILEGIKGIQHDHGLHAVVFGPDGKWYFNFGNAGEQLVDKNGQPIKDVDGRLIDPAHYKQGMVFRCDADFTHFEVLGQNFRNNFEVALDSYGNMWQSDNDDDGNKGVRINYVMDYGNYGYTDEMTGAGWEVNRTNLETEIPLRHWHLNDPGVVPNVLQTGAGSPCGMVVYEGDLLPAAFRGFPIHADAGPNVVRAYVHEPVGAGYQAKIVNIVEGANDQWFRPCDVCVAPDGSLFVADWYDPGVGGHQAGDQNRGRVFRIAPPAVSQYVVPVHNFGSPEGLLTALANPNLSVQYKAWQVLNTNPALYETILNQVWQLSPNKQLRARVLWLLMKGPNGPKYVQAAASESDPAYRIMALRAARQGCAPVLDIVATLAKDKDMSVLRECALALHHSKDPRAAELWTQLALRHNGKDRWYLEALGIGADQNWDAFFAAWLQKVGKTPLLEAGQRDIIWRARCGAAAPLLGQLAQDKNVPLQERLRYFRAFDFIMAKEKSEVLLGIVQAKENDPALTKLALRHLDKDFVKTNAAAKKSLMDLMANLKGNEYIEFAGRYLLPEQNQRLFDQILTNTDRQKSADVLFNTPGGIQMYQKFLKNRKDEARTIALLDAIRSSGGQTQISMIRQVAFDKKQSDLVRRTATEYLGSSWGGEDLVLELLKNKQIEPRFILAAVQGVSHAWRITVRNEAQKYLGGASAGSDKPIPEISELVKLEGNPSKGIALFETNCANCHQVNGKGINYGPALSEIGSKLPKEGQYMAILHPNAGVSFGYEGWEISLKDGSVLTGMIASKTETELVLKIPGGTTRTIPTKEITRRKQLADSLMPAGFHYAMNNEQLADLVSYLLSLKK